MGLPGGFYQQTLSHSFPLKIGIRKLDPSHLFRQNLWERLRESSCHKCRNKNKPFKARCSRRCFKKKAECFLCSLRQNPFLWFLLPRYGWQHLHPPNIPQTASPDLPENRQINLLRCTRRFPESSAARIRTCLSLLLHSEQLPVHSNP